MVEDILDGKSGNYTAQNQQFEASYKTGIGHWRSHPLSPLAEEFIEGADRLLDIGSGGGEKTLTFASLSPNFSVVGVDQSLHAVVAAQKLLDENAQLRGKVTFIRADALSLPLADQSFDKFHDYLCFTHIHQKDWPQYFHEAARVVRSGGRGLIITFSKEDKDFYGYRIRQLDEDWIVFRNDHDGIKRPNQAINDGFGYHFAKGHQLYEAVQPYFNVMKLELREHPHPDHKGKRFLWHLLIEKD